VEEGVGPEHLELQLEKLRSGLLRMHPKYVSALLHWVRVKNGADQTRNTKIQQHSKLDVTKAVEAIRSQEGSAAAEQEKRRSLLEGAVEDRRRAIAKQVLNRLLKAMTQVQECFASTEELESALGMAIQAQR
jgi:hypothetical protein